MNIDVNSLLASFLISSIGFVLFFYGKRMRRMPQLGVGLLLMIYPYFVTSIPLVFAIGALLLALMWLAIRNGM
jgi:hypothetical protein